MGLAKLGKGMLSSVEQAFVGRDKRQAPLKMPAWEATVGGPWHLTFTLGQLGNLNF